MSIYHKLVLTSLDAWMLERSYIYGWNKAFKSDFFCFHTCFRYEIDRWFTLKFIPIYDVLVHVLRWNPPKLPRTIGSISSVPIYTVTSSFVDALITVVCGPTWTNQWKVHCRSPAMQVWIIKYVSINTSRNQLPDTTLAHLRPSQLDPPRTHLLFTQNITHVYTCINVSHNRADARAPLTRPNHTCDYYLG
jgi:hypothetical protein